MTAPLPRASNALRRRATSWRPATTVACSGSGARSATPPPGRTWWCRWDHTGPTWISTCFTVGPVRPDWALPLWSPDLRERLAALGWLGWFSRRVEIHSRIARVESTQAVAVADATVAAISEWINGLARWAGARPFPRPTGRAPMVPRD